MRIHLNSVIAVTDPYDSGRSAKRSGVIDELVTCSHISVTMMVNNADHMRVFKAICGLFIFTVVYQNHVKACGVIQERRFFHSRRLQDIFCLVTDLSQHNRLCVIAKLFQKPGVGNSAADRIRIRTLMSRHINRPVDQIQPFQFTFIKEYVQFAVCFQLGNLVLKLLDFILCGSCFLCSTAAV